MGHLIITTVLAVLGVAFAIVVSATGKLVADDLKAWVPRLTTRLIDRAIARLPEDQRNRYGEEGSSHINDVPGELSKICAAAYLILAARKILPETQTGLDARPGQTRSGARVVVMQTSFSAEFSAEFSRPLER